MLATDKLVKLDKVNNLVELARTGQGEIVINFREAFCQTMMDNNVRFDFETKVFAEKLLIVLRRGKALLYKLNRKTREHERVGPVVFPLDFLKWMGERMGITYEVYIRLDKRERGECLAYMALWTLWHDK